MTEAVTVTVVNFNGRESIVDCIEAARALRPAPAEVIVVDNASTDDSIELVERQCPDVRLIRLEENLGPCPARNRGLEEARTRLVYQLDNDVIVAPDSLAKLLDAWRAVPDVALAQPRSVFDANRHVIHYDGGFFHYVGLMTLRHFYRPRTEALTETAEVDAVISLALLVDRDSVLEAGGYDPSFFILFEDHDLSYRLRARGHKLLSVAPALVFHREGTEGISYREGPRYPARRAYLQSRNRWLVLAKNHHRRTILLCLPGLVVFEFVWAVFALKQGMFASYLKGKKDMLGLLGHARRQRRLLGASRQIGDRQLLRAEPLTFTPLIERSRAMVVAERVLNFVLAAWWKLVRWLVP